jgi:predicted AAA+ superfamily ATPase
MLREGKKGKSALLILDEAQKITNWSEAVKRLWDEDSAGDLL